jgi:dTDP-4-dehydrorhamnose reductase
VRILIIGANGMLGRDILRQWPDEELIAADVQDADIRNREQVRQLLARAKPDWIILTAAYTDVDGAENKPELAHDVNAKGAENVARAAREFGVRLFYISTDYVFDGASSRPYETSDPVHPLSVYGASKAAGESAVQKYADQWCIGRTSWLFGALGASFPEKILQAAATRTELKVVADHVGSPTFTRDLATAILALVRADARGIVHITNAGSCSWMEFAAEVLRQAGRDSVRVLPITTAEAGRLAQRPLFSILSPASLHARGIYLRNWKDALAVYLEDLRQAGKLA